MQVSIEHTEHTEGIFKKKTFYWVECTVAFTEEEKAIVKQRQLEEWVVLKRQPPATAPGAGFDWDLKIKSLIKGKKERHCFSTPVEAKRYHDELAQALKEMKAFITQNAETAKGETFEL